MTPLGIAVACLAPRVFFSMAEMAFIAANPSAPPSAEAGTHRRDYLDAFRRPERTLSPR